MSDEALLALGEGLKKNRGLETLGVMMRGEGAGVGVWQQFVLCLNKNRHLTELVIDDRSAICLEVAAVSETRRQQGLPLLEVI